MRKLFLSITFIAFSLLLMANTTLPMTETKSDFGSEQDALKVQSYNLLERADRDSNARHTSIRTQREPWDILFHWNTHTDGGEQGIATDGTHFYTAKWNAPGGFARYDMSGTWLADFTITGVGGVRDLTYDGEFFYGGASTAMIYKLDLANETLVSTITATGATVRHCTYDPEADNGNGGFWVGNWADLRLVSMTGATLQTVTTAIASVYGSAYDPYTDGGPYLWLFSQTNDVTIQQFRISDHALTGVTHMATDIPGYVAGDIAGGLFSYEDPVSGLFVLLGNIQRQPNLVFAYELAVVADPQAPGMATNLEATAGANGALSATITFNNPSHNVGGDPLTALSSVEIYRGDDLIHTINNPTIGGAASYTDNDVPVAGMTQYKVVGENTHGTGLPATTTVYVGTDVPSAPENVVLEAVGADGQITWDAPTEGLNGGYFPGTNLTYTVLRYPGAIMVAEDITATQYLDDSIVVIDNYHYSVTASNNIGEGGTAYSNSVVLGSDDDLLIAFLGTGTETNTTTGAAPINIFYRSIRTQTVYTATELNNAGIFGSNDLVSLGYYVTGLPAESLPNFRVRIKHTTAANASAHDPGPYTQVYQNATFMPTTDQWNMLPFTTPFEWNGVDNISIDTTFDMVVNWNSSGQQRIYTAPTGMRFVRSDGTNQGDATTTTTVDYKPQVQMMFSPSGVGMGSMSGYVYDSDTDDPVSGALVSIEDFPTTQTTNTQGHYVFTHAPVGAHNVTASKHGYYDDTALVTIIESENTEQDFEIQLLPQVDITGRVVGSDAPDTGLQGATITLSGYEDYQAMTNATGHFTLEDVFADHTYTMMITHENYQNHTQDVVVGDVNLDLGDMVLEEIAFAPHSVVAEVTDDNDVHITWESPGLQPDLIMLRQHSNEDEDAYFQSYNIGYGVVFDLAEYPGATLEHIDYRHSPWGINGTWQYRIHLVDWTNFTTIAVLGPYSTTLDDGWETNVDLGSVAGNNGLVGVLIEPMGNSPTDAYPCIDGDGTLNGYSVTAPITDFSDYTITTLVGDFLIDLWILHYGRELSLQTNLVNSTTFEHNRESRDSLLSSVNRAEVKLNASQSRLSANRQTGDSAQYLFTQAAFTEQQSQLQRNTRSLEGYVVYRFLAADQNNEDLWDEIETITNPGITESTDTDWSTLDPGVYRYAVKAIYTNNVLSNPAFSNTLEHSMSALVTITLTTNSGDPVAGAQVTLENVDGDPDHVYEATSPASGILVFPNVWRGTYILTAHLTGFDEHQETNVEIMDDTFMHSIEFIESLDPVVDLQYEIHNGNNVVLQWLEPGSAAGTEQWMHWDSGDNHDSIGTGQAAQFSVATRFTPQNLEDLEVGGLYLTTIRFWPSVPTATYTLKVWQGGSSTPWNAGNEVVSQAVPNVTAETWNEVVLNNPVLIDPAQEIWFGYGINTPEGYPAGCDAGPAVNGYGNMMYFGDEWNTLIGIAPTLDYNWNIQGYAGASRGDKAVGLANTRNDIEQRDEMASRALLGYKIIRNETVLVEQHGSLTYTDSNVLFGTYVYSVIAQYTTGESEAVMTEQVNILNVDDDLITIPLVTELKGNYPNPFNPDTNIAFSLKEAEMVTLDIYNVKGQKIRTLVRDELTAGNHTVVWNGRNDNNKEVGSGIFFYRMKTDSYSETRKMIMMK